MPNSPIAVAAPLVCWAIEQHVPYEGSFVESLWLTKELAEQELARIRNPNIDRTIEEWTIGETVTS